MAKEAIDFLKHYKRKESRKLAKLVARWADLPVAWTIEPAAKQFLKDHRLEVADLNHVLRTARECYPASDGATYVRGSTVDEVDALIVVRPSKEGEPLSLTFLNARLFTDEDDLVG